MPLLISLCRTRLPLFNHFQILHRPFVKKWCVDNLLAGHEPREQAAPPSIATAAEKAAKTAEKPVRRASRGSVSSLRQSQGRSPSPISPTPAAGQHINTNANSSPPPAGAAPRASASTRARVSTPPLPAVSAVSAAVSNANAPPAVAFSVELSPPKRAAPPGLGMRRASRERKSEKSSEGSSEANSRRASGGGSNASPSDAVTATAGTKAAGKAAGQRGQRGTRAVDGPRHSKNANANGSGNGIMRTSPTTKTPSRSDTVSMGARGGGGDPLPSPATRVVAGGARGGLHKGRANPNPKVVAAAALARDATASLASNPGTDNSDNDALGATMVLDHMGSTSAQRVPHVTATTGQQP